MPDSKEAKAATAPASPARPDIAWTFDLRNTLGVVFARAIFHVPNRACLDDVTTKEESRPRLCCSIAEVPDKGICSVGFVIRNLRRRSEFPYELIVEFLREKETTCRGFARGDYIRVVGQCEMGSNKSIPAEPTLNVCSSRMDWDKGCKAFFPMCFQEDGLLTVTCVFHYTPLANALAQVPEAKAQEESKPKRKPAIVVRTYETRSKTKL